MMISFNDFVYYYILKNKATRKIKVYEVLKILGLESEVGYYLRDEVFQQIMV